TRFSRDWSSDVCSSDLPPPGHLKEMLKAHGEGTSASFLGPMRPEYQQREARLAVMDAQGIESILLFPTFGVTFEHALRHDPEARSEERRVGKEGRARRA